MCKERQPLELQLKASILPYRQHLILPLASRGWVAREARNTAETEGRRVSHMLVAYVRGGNMSQEGTHGWGSKFGSECDSSSARWLELKVTPQLGCALPRQHKSATPELQLQGIPTTLVSQQSSTAN